MNRVAQGVLSPPARWRELAAKRQDIAAGAGSRPGTEDPRAVAALVVVALMVAIALPAMSLPMG